MIIENCNINNTALSLHQQKAVSTLHFSWEESITQGRPTLKIAALIMTYSTFTSPTVARGDTFMRNHSLLACRLTTTLKEQDGENVNPFQNSPVHPMF